LGLRTVHGGIVKEEKRKKQEKTHSLLITAMFSVLLHSFAPFAFLCAFAWKFASKFSNEVIGFQMAAAGIFFQKMFE
jgi:hypothetical protein